MHVLVRLGQQQQRPGVSNRHGEGRRGRAGAPAIRARWRRQRVSSGGGSVARALQTRAHSAHAQTVELRILRDEIGTVRVQVTRRHLDRARSAVDHLFCKPERERSRSREAVKHAHTPISRTQPGICSAVQLMRAGLDCRLQLDDAHRAVQRHLRVVEAGLRARTGIQAGGDAEPDSTLGQGDATIVHRRNGLCQVSAHGCP